MPDIAPPVNSPGRKNVIRARGHHRGGYRAADGYRSRAGAGEPFRFLTPGVRGMVFRSRDQGRSRRSEQMLTAGSDELSAEFQHR
jgi:orotidine-5'-phosphate decarboxylase